jgi:hypothetical protein
MRRILGSILLLAMVCGSIGCTTCSVCDDCGIVDDINYGVIRKPKCGQCGAAAPANAHVDGSAAGKEVVPAN